MPKNVKPKTDATQIIVVMRHGNKDGDSLTDLGERQIKAAVKTLIATGFRFPRIAHSPTTRTKRCAEIAGCALLRVRDVVHYDSDVNGLSFKDPFAQAFNGDNSIFEIELGDIKKSGNTLANALIVSNYARLAQAHLSAYLIELAADMRKRREVEAICFSHSPFHTLAALDQSIPYEGPEASCVIYKVQDGRIIDARFILAPYVE